VGCCVAAPILDHTGSDNSHEYCPAGPAHPLEATVDHQRARESRRRYFSQIGNELTQRTDDLLHGRKENDRIQPDCHQRVPFRH
jgi:hypothetical protein